MTSAPVSVSGGTPTLTLNDGFYTGSQSEYATIVTPGAAGYRADLLSEGVGFYAPFETFT